MTDLDTELLPDKTPCLRWWRADDRRWIVLITDDGTDTGYRRWYRPWLGLWALVDLLRARF